MIICVELGARSAVALGLQVVPTAVEARFQTLCYIVTYYVS